MSYDPDLPPVDVAWQCVGAGLILALLALAMCGCCQTCPVYDAPVLVDASAIWRCGDHWCVSDGWMAAHEADESAMQQALGGCLEALRSCPD